MAANAVKAGSKAPDFELDDQNEKKFRLSDFRGKKVLLSFHPLAWTGVCAKQMQSLEANFDEFGKLNAIAVGVNVDSVPSKKAWADSLGISKTRLLADFWPHGGVAQKFGIFREREGFSERANVIIGSDGKAAFFKVYPIGDLPDIREILAKIKEIG
ncbi:MAG: redoxin domain-containing protein [Euryarchaeota archaeon]|nr:redoxin domain-containing protein [Euryarchaeota archaeon]